MRYTDVEHEPTMQDFDAMDAQDDGEEACANGLLLSDNPFPAGSRNHVAWSDGWHTFQSNVRTEWESDNHDRANRAEQ